MRLTIRILGLDLLGIELATSDEDDDDKARDLSGGSLGAERIEAGATDWHMGFTNGRGEE